jgi:hypothetical protein
MGRSPLSASRSALNKLTRAPLVWFPTKGSAPGSIPAMILNSSPATWPGVPMPGEPKLILPGLAFGVGRELGNRLGRHRGIDHHHEGKADEARDRRDVAQEHEIELVVERRVDRVQRADDEERVAIRRRPHHRFGADIVAAPWAVFDHELLAQPLREPRRD